MKKKLFVIILCLLLVLPNITYSVHADTPAEPSLRSQSAVVMDLDSGRFLYTHEPHKKLVPAGLSKLVTAYLALETLPLKDSLTVTSQDLSSVPEDAITIGLENGNHLTVEDAVYAALLGSSTEACLVLSRAVSGSEASFCDAMNSFAASLSCEDTVFKNSYGLSADGQSISAYDLAKIAREVYKNDTMRKVLKTESYDFTDSTTFWNSNKMIYSWDELHYSACTGGKNGYIVGYGGNFVCYAEKDGLRLVAVVMGADQDEEYYADAKDLLEYCFSSFSSCYPLTGFTIDEVQAEGIVLDNYYESITHNLPSYSFSTGVSFLLPSGTKPEDVEKNVTFYDSPQGSVAGYISCNYKGEHLGDVPIYLDSENVGALRFRLSGKTISSGSDSSGEGFVVLPVASNGNASGGQTVTISDSGNQTVTEAAAPGAQTDSSSEDVSSNHSSTTKNHSSNNEKKKSSVMITIILIAVLLLLLAGFIWFFYRWINVKKEREKRKEETRKMMERRKQELSLYGDDDYSEEDDLADKDSLSEEDDLIADDGYSDDNHFSKYDDSADEDEED